METKEQYMVTPVMDFAETVKMINKMKVNVESNISLVNQLQANIVTLQESTAHGLVVHDGKVLVQVERKAREGDYVVFENANGIYTRDNKFYEVLRERNGEVFYEENGIDGYLIYTWDSHPNPKVYEVIGNLPQSDVVAVEKKCTHLTANQKRARVIAMAKLFVEDQKTCHTGIVAKGNPHEGKIRTYKGIYKRKQGNIEYISNAEFIRKGNRVTCLLKGVETSKVHFVGRAECHADDVFNEHIGRAVALAKALDIVEQLPPDILKAVQPDSFVKGMKVVSSTEYIYEILERNWKGECYVDDFYYFLDSSLRKGVKIIDDTDAVYSLQGGEN